MSFDHLVGGALFDPIDEAFPLLRAAARPFAGPRRFMHTIGGQQYQADAGSCTAHGYSVPIEAVAATLGADFQVCRQDLYYGARRVENNGAETRDGGAYPSKVREWMRDYGTLPESVKAYRPADVTTWKPPASVANRRRLLAALYAPVALSADAVLSELTTRGPLPLCHAVYGQMVNSLPADGVEGGAAGAVLGGHCRAAVGYDLDHAAGPCILVMNSWKGWGIAHPDSATDSRFAKNRDSFSWVRFAVFNDAKWLQSLDRLEKMPEVAP